jgi:flagellar motor switch protein FliG
MLLMSLDATTASELLKGVDPDVIQELAVELAYLDAAGYRNSKETTEVAQQFCNSLNSHETFQIDAFLNEMLKNTIGEDKAGQIKMQIQDLLHKRDPFIAIRSADAYTIGAILEHEHPQAAAVVLSELPAKKSSEVLGLLGESVRMTVIGRITTCDTVTQEAKARIAQAICDRLKAFSPEQGGEMQARPEQSLRKVAVILRNLGPELREGLLGAIKEKDEEASAKVADLMIIWEDIRQIADRPLQEGLRGADSKQLALALFGADEAIAEKIKSNISERAKETLEEETSLMSAPKKNEIEEARSAIVASLRELDAKGELTFIEE